MLKCAISCTSTFQALPRFQKLNGNTEKVDMNLPTISTALVTMNRRHLSLYAPVYSHMVSPCFQMCVYCRGLTGSDTPISSPQ